MRIPRMWHQHIAPLIMEILISIIEIHTSVYIYAIPEAWDMCIGSERGWGIWRP